MTLDLTPFTLFWADEFTELKLSDAGTRPAGANWYTHTPWGGDFGDATFCGAASGVFAIVSKGGSDSVLEIKMRRNATTNHLEGGLISTHFPDGTNALGETDPVGYYEVRAWLPDAIAGVWPAPQWGLEQERLVVAGRDHVLELDVCEFYGALVDRYTTVVHDWDWNGATAQGEANSRVFNAPPGLLGAFHTYGVEITEDKHQTYYFDREPYLTLGPTTAAWPSNYGTMLNTPLIWMLNFAAGGGWPIDPELGTTKPASLFIDYFHVHKRVNTMFETDFTITPAGQDISVIPGITRAQGSDGAMTINAASGVDSNATALTGNCYLLPSTGSLSHGVKARMKDMSATSGPLLCVRCTDHANWIGVRWTNKSFELVKKIAGSAALVPGGAVAALTNLPDDMIDIWIDALNNVHVLINDVEKVVVNVPAPTLTAQTCGLIPRSTVKLQWIDDLASGPR